jgi:hypothetical protein
MIQMSTGGSVMLVTRVTGGGEGQRRRHGMAISPMASRAMALSYSRLDRLVRIDTAGWRTIRIVWIVNTLLALSTMRSQAANFFS